MSALQLIVGSILLGAIVLIVGLVQLVPNAADADHKYIFLGSGGILLVMGLVMTGMRCYCIHCRSPHGVVVETPPTLDAVNSIDVLVQRDTQVGTFAAFFKFSRFAQYFLNNSDTGSSCFGDL